MRVILTFFKVYTEFIERGLSASGPRDNRACLFPLARYPRANSPVAWPPKECIWVCWQVKENMTLKCVTVICCAFSMSRHIVTWSFVTNFLVENSKVEITSFRLKSGLSVKHRVIVVLRTCTVVCCYWTFTLSLLRSLKPEVDRAEVAC